MQMAKSQVLFVIENGPTKSKWPTKPTPRGLRTCSCPVHCFSCWFQWIFLSFETYRYSQTLDIKVISSLRNKLSSRWIANWQTVEEQFSNSRNWQYAGKHQLAMHILKKFLRWFCLVLNHIHQWSDLWCAQMKPIVAFLDVSFVKLVVQRKLHHLQWRCSGSWFFGNCMCGNSQNYQPESSCQKNRRGVQLHPPLLMDSF